MLTDIRIETEVEDVAAVMLELYVLVSYVILMLQLVY